MAPNFVATFDEVLVSHRKFPKNHAIENRNISLLGCVVRFKEAWGSFSQQSIRGLTR